MSRGPRKKFRDKQTLGEPDVNSVEVERQGEALTLKFTSKVTGLKPITTIQSLNRNRNRGPSRAGGRQ